MINSGSETSNQYSDGENDSNIYIMQFDPQQVSVPIASDRTDLTTNAPASSNTSSSRYQSPYDAQILNEIQNLVIENLRFENGDNEASYVCKYIFDGARLDKLLVGKEVLKTSNEYEVIYTESLANKNGVSTNDIFIRSGHFARLVKNHIFDNNPTLLKSKFGETNTYSKTLKLGFKLMFFDSNRRSIHYVNLIEALRVIGRELGNRSDISDSGDNESIQGTSSIDSENFEDNNMTSSNRRNFGSLEETSSIGSSSLKDGASNNDKMKKRKVFKASKQFVHLPTSTQTSSSQFSQPSTSAPIPSSAGILVPVLNINHTSSSSSMHPSQLGNSNSSSFSNGGSAHTSGINNLEDEADVIEGEICDILDKLDLLKSQDLYGI